MMATNKSAWLITAKTNLHVGDEASTGYGLIDKSIQRDPLTSLPCINSSSLKGALNEFCCCKGLTPEERISIFGSDKLTKKEAQKGGDLFFDATILFIPIQDDEQLYKLAFCREVLERFVNKIKLFDSASTLSADNLIKKIEELTKKATQSKTMEEFKNICDDDSLPIIARNVLENGESKNLWYEQILPSETILGTLIQSKGSKLEATISNQIVQIGANATIGYGYCQFTKL